MNRAAMPSDSAREMVAELREVLLDFVIPQYRDFKIGSYVYSSESGLLTGLEPTCVWAEASNSDHAEYLRRMGFAECPDRPGRYEIRLAAPTLAG